MKKAAAATALPVIGSGDSIEQIYDPAREAREFTQRWNDWLRLKRLSPCQRYLNGEFGIAIRCVGIDPRQDGLVFRLVPSIVN